MTDGPVDLRTRADSRQHCHRDAEGAQQLRVPRQRMQIHQLGSTRVGDIRDVDSTVGTSSEVPCYVRVDVSEDYLSILSLLAYARHMFQQPADFQGAEVSAERKPRQDPKPVLTAIPG